MRLNLILLVLAFTIVAILISIYMHDPTTPVILNNIGFKYTDIVHGVFASRVLSKELCMNALFANDANDWFNLTELQNYCRSLNMVPIPYIHYKFEYPPIVGLLWYISTYVALSPLIGHDIDVLGLPMDSIENAERIHFYIHAVVDAISILITVVITAKLMIYLYGALDKRILLLPLLPSLILYGVYNWDAIATMFMVLAIYAFLKKRYLTSGALLGLAISTKLLPIAIAVILCYELYNQYMKKISVDPFKKFTIGLVITAGIPYITLAILAPQGFAAFIAHHASWYCENCIYMIVCPDINNPVHRALSMVVILILMLVLMTVDLNEPMKIVLASFLAITTITLFNYVFTPQMLLLIEPLALLALPTNLLKLFIVVDILNAGIILLFFKDLELRSLLAPILGIEVKHNPWTIDSPVQWIAILRNVLLLYIFVYMFSCLLKGRKQPLNSIIECRQRTQILSADQGSSPKHSCS